jgi:hypothetical protein
LAPSTTAAATSASATAATAATAGNLELGGGAATTPATSPSGRKRAKQAAPTFKFKFQEGYSNAVRRPVRLQDLV